MTSARLAFVVSVAVLAAQGCASFAPAGAAPGGDSSDLSAQVFKVQKDTALLLEKVDKLQQALADRSNGGACAEAAARSENVEKQLRVLEEQLLATQKRLDDTLGELRSQRRPARPPAPETTPTPDAGAPSGAAPAMDKAAAPAPGAGQSPEDLFNGAYADYSRGNYDLALGGFEAALRADPQGPLADDSQYWIGEVLFARAQYLDAAAAFDKVVTGWPNGDKVAMARLKRGYALFEGKKTADGVLELQRVIQTWPKSDEARLARDFLRRKGVVVE